MSLPASQQRALDAIDSDLRGADTRLARMFSVFTELTRLEKMPPAETFQPVRWWTRAGRRTARRAAARLHAARLPPSQPPGGGLGVARPGPARPDPARPARSRLGTIVLVPLLLAATLSLLLLSMLTTRPTGSGRCAAPTVFMAPVRLSSHRGLRRGGQPRTGPAGG